MSNTPPTSENNGGQALLEALKEIAEVAAIYGESGERTGRVDGKIKAALQLIVAEKREAKIEALDHVIDIYNTLFEPNGEFRSFDSLKKEDVANLYLRIGEYIRKLQAERTPHEL
jgi:hypothetical protein